MELEENQLASLFPSVAAQMRNALSNLYLAAGQIAPASAREQDPALDQKAARLDQSYYQLLRLVNNLSMAACLAEDAPLPLSNKDLVEFVGGWCEEVASVAEDLGVEVRFSCVKDRLVCAVAPDALRQILDHLMSNAMKFTPAGGKITVELKETGGRVFLSVIDTGCGISAERMEMLFDRYLHGNSTDLPRHGLGLGLPLCRHLAEAQGGVIVADSREGQGSRFTVSLPLKQVAGSVSDIPIIRGGGFNRTLLALADALPAKAFLQRNQD